MILFLDNVVYNHIVTFITFLCSFPVCSYLPLAKNTYFKNTFIEVVCVHTFEGSNVFRVHVKSSRLPMTEYLRKDFHKVVNLPWCRYGGGKLFTIPGIFLKHVLLNM